MGQLVLSRRVHERIVISTPNGDVVVELCDIDGNRVKIGFECDRKIPIYRSELHPEVKETK